MPGANYMGGRRNAAKARARDTDGRLQKNHFGKQRLSVLAKGLGRTSLGSANIPGSSATPTVANISLAHAHRVQEDRHQFYDAYKEPPVTPPRKRRKVERTPRGGSSGGSTSGRSSALIRELDTTEPMFMRAEINRLLSRPDFAGLNNYEDNTRRQSSPYDDMLDEETQAIDRDYSARYSSSPPLGTTSTHPASYHAASPRPNYQEYDSSEPNEDVQGSVPDYEDPFVYGQAEHRNDLLLTLQYNHPDDSMSDAGIKSNGSDGILASHESIGGPSPNRVFSVSSPSTNGSMPHTSSSSHVSILKRVPLSEPTVPSRPSPNAHMSEASPDYDEFLSCIPSPDTFLREQGDQFVQSSLLDVMDGHLFEDSDPWGALRRLLDVGSPRPRDRSQTSSGPIARESRTASSTSNTHTLGPRRSVELAEPLFGPEFADTGAQQIVETSAPEIPLEAWLEDILECDTMESTQQSASAMHPREPATTIPDPESGGASQTLEEVSQGDYQKPHEICLPTILDVTSSVDSEHCAEDDAATDSGQTPASSEQQLVAGPALFSDDDDA